MKKTLGLVLVATFFIGAVSAWTYFEQDKRHREEVERLSRPRTVARLTVLAREQTPDGHWRTTAEIVGLDAEGEPAGKLKCTLERLEELLTELPDGEAEPMRPDATYDLILDPAGGFTLIKTQAAGR